MDSAPLWRAGTVAHYVDAAYYDQAYRRRTTDKRYYVQHAKGRMLELGAGTGRITVPVGDTLSKSGGSIVGVESMPPMLERAAARLARAPRRVRDCVRFEQGNFLELDLGERFDQVTAPFNTLMHVYTLEHFQVLLRRVRMHLKPGGAFRFDVLVPNPAALARDPERFYRSGTVPLPSTGRRYKYSERFDYDPATQVQLVEMRFECVTDPEEVHIVPLAHRQFFPAELRALLQLGGFEVLRVDGGFGREPLDSYAESQVVLCRPR